MCIIYLQKSVFPFKNGEIEVHGDFTESFDQIFSSGELSMMYSSAVHLPNTWAAVFRISWF